MERFKILKKLGEGGNSRAYLARDKRTGDLITIKFAKNISATGQQSPFANEADILKEFGKRNCAELISNGRIPRLVAFEGDHIAVSFVSGKNLLELLKQKGRLKEKQVIAIAKDLLTIFRALHENDTPIVYRDLKPANIIINCEGRACLIDFGAARIYQRKCKTEDTINLGTIGYAAPEQYGSLGQTDEQTDIYCFGMTLLSLLTGINARDSDALSMARSGAWKNISPEMLAFIERCIKADRGKRFNSFKEAEESFDKVPAKKTARKALKVVKITALALVTSALVTVGVFYEEEAAKVISNDLVVRVPAVRYRISIARQRICDFADSLIKEEDI